ncbi:glutathione S-transferase P-like [Sigmodon hispidus]
MSSLDVTDPGLYGKDQQEAALVDVVNDALDDLFRHLGQQFLRNYEEGKAQYLKELPGHLKPFETLLAQTSMVNPSLWVTRTEAKLLDLLLNHELLFPDYLKDVPLLSAYVAGLRARPKLKAFLESPEHLKSPTRDQGSEQRFTIKSRF